MATVREIFNYIDKFYPYITQENFDNSGIMVDCGNQIKKILFSLDVTNDVIEYAVQTGADLIVTHHPVIFNALKKLEYDSPAFRLASCGVSSISAHTNYDIGENGINDVLASKLALQNVRPVFKISESIINGMRRDNYLGRMGELPREMTPAEFAEYVCEKLDIPQLEYAHGEKNIRTVAVGGGACGEYIFECMAAGADAFVSGEAKHHELLFAKSSEITLVVAGHYATESLAMERLSDIIKQGFPSVDVEITYIDDPISYANIKGGK